MPQYAVIYFPGAAPELAARLLRLSGNCVRNYRLRASCLDLHAVQSASALLIVGGDRAVATVCEKLVALLQRWSEPVPTIESDSDATRWLDENAARLPAGDDVKACERFLAAMFHQQWQQEFADRQPGQPRWKPTRDTAWISAHHGADHVDLTSTAFEDLPCDWQAENLTAAKTALELVDNAVRRGAPLDDAFVEAAAGEVHRKWLERNAKTAPDTLRADFAKLPAAEQNKDRAQIWFAIYVCRAGNRHTP